MKKSIKNAISIMCLLVLIYALYTLIITITLNSSGSEIQKINYKDFKQALVSGDVAAVTYEESNNYIKFFAKPNLFDKEKTKEEEPTTTMVHGNSDVKIDYNDKEILDELLKEHGKNSYTIYYTNYPNYEEFNKDVLESGADYTHVKPFSSSLLSILTVVEIVLFIIFVVTMLSSVFSTKGGNPSIFNVGDTEIKKQTSTTKFSDVIGHEEIMEDIKFISSLVKDPKKGEKMGVKVPKGMLLTGIPGTGKTLIAKAIAGEADVPFYYFNASNFVEVYVGVGAKRVRKLFAEAKKNAPCVVFIDEIDAIGKKRNDQGGNGEADQTLLALLQEMDGFSPRTGVFVIAATNKPKSLDSGLVRAGRFDRQIEVNPPRDWSVRKLLFDHYLKSMKLSDDIDTELISRQTSGFTGADIEMICNEAGIIALMNKKEFINMNCLQEAIDKKVFHGNKSKRKALELDRNYVAYHEAGHAIMSLLTNTPVARASIVGTTSGVGGAVFHNDNDSMFRTIQELRNEVMIAYAGRASEEIKFAVPTTGASNDIEQATNIMIHYIESYGFNSEFGLINMKMVRDVAPAVDGDIVTQLSKMSKELYEVTKETLKQNYEKVEKLAQELLSKETLTGPEIEDLVDIHPTT